MTTNDPFTTADSRWDESPHPLADYCEHAGVGKACGRCRRKFDAAAQWARDYLAAQEPTDAECIHVLNVVHTDLGQPTRKNFEWSQAAIQRCREAMVSARRTRKDPTR